MTVVTGDIVSHVRAALGFELGLTESGRPKILGPALGKPKWPHKLAHHRTVAIDTTPTADGEFWPTPRFEILIANLDAVGISVIQIGDATSERLARANHHYRKLANPERAGVIANCLLWIGMNTPWRFVAAALDKPQIVIASAQSHIEPRWKDTYVVDASSHAPESKTLGPISVTAVAAAVTSALKQLGATPST